MKTKIIGLALALAATSLCTKAVASDFSGSLDLTSVDVVASHSINNSSSAEGSLPWTTLIAVAIVINCPILLCSVKTLLQKLKAEHSDFAVSLPNRTEKNLRHKEPSLV